MDRAAKIIELQEARKRKLYGTGIGVALFDTGMSMQHPDLVGAKRVVAYKDFVNGRISGYDDNGHGTHVAGIIGGTGKASGGKYGGVAPDCYFVVIKILDRDGNGDVPVVLRGIDWLLKHQARYQIRVVNISMGTTGKVEIKEKSELVEGVNALWNAGMVVCAAAGNNGPKEQSIGAPGNSRKIITVGAFEDESGERGKPKVQFYSGRGPTEECICKPDLVAPGSHIISCNWKGEKGRLGRQNPFYIKKSGTSMATPMVSGAVSLLLEQNPSMTNREVKIRLKNSAVDKGESHSLQGWGMLNIRRMLG